jgi:hypothetical protein
MTWMRERDALIAQTLAFVQSVAGTSEDAGAALPRLAPKQPQTAAASVDLGPVVMARRAEPPQVLPKDLPRTPPVSRPIVSSEFRSEIGARIASFRAHQERFRREREDYFNATLGKARAAINDVSSSKEL